MAEMMNELKIMRGNQERNQGQTFGAKAGSGATWAIVLGAIAVMNFVFLFLKK